MRYNRVGRTGLVVSELALGTMNFHRRTGPAGGGVRGADGDVLIRQALDAGVNFIDTSNNYASGQAEEIVGDALRRLGVGRSGIVVATKGGGVVRAGPNQGGAGRRHLLEQVDASLARLGLDLVDLYQLHLWDPATPVEETLRALEDIVSSGRARYVGTSNWAAWHVMKALGIADRQGFNRLATVQAYYSAASCDIERELVPLVRGEGLGLIVWSPLARGLLSGAYRRDLAAPPRPGGGFDFLFVDLERAYDLVEAMAAMAARRGAGIARIALAWLLHQPCVTSIVMGVDGGDQLAENLAAADVVLAAEELAELDRLSALTPEYPGWMIARQSRQLEQASERPAITEDRGAF